MRVVNDRRRLPRVAWNGQAVVQTRRGEVHGVGLDLSADGMAVLAPSPGKVKERVRIHVQLGDFPLLTDARVVRMTKRRDGYRWALRFDRLDERMRANLEGFVRQQLANAARVRQAQLYAQRLKGGALPTPPNATPPPSSFTPAPAGVPTPAPIDPRVRAGITLPPVELPNLGVAGVPEPTEVSLEGLAEVLPHRPLEIELPSMAPGPDQPVLDIGDAPSSTDPVYVPYQPSSATEEATLLGEGPMTSSPSREPQVAVTPAPEVEATPAEVLAPGVIDISDDEDLSLEDILAEVEAGGTLVPEANAGTPVSDLQMPPKRQAAKEPAAGLGDVQVLYDDVGDDDATQTRDEPPVAPTVVTGAGGAGAAARHGAPTDDAPVSARGLLEEAPMDAVPYLDRGLSDDAPALVGAPMDDAPALDDGLLDEVPPLDGGLSDDAPALVGAPMDEAPALDGGPLDDAPALDGELLLDDAPALAGASMDDAPALDNGLLDEAPALSGAPMNLGPAMSGAPLEDGPALDSGLLDDVPALVAAPKGDAPVVAGAPFSDVLPSARNTLLPGPPGPSPESPSQEFGGAPFTSGPAENSGEISLAEFAPEMQRAAAEAKEEATPPEPENPYATPLPSNAEPYIPVSSHSLREAEEGAPLPSHVPTPEKNDAAEEEDEEDDEVLPEPPALLDPVDAEEPVLPGPPSSTRTLYGDDAEPFDPYSPNPAPSAGAAPTRLGSAPRALGELPPVVEGLYTPTSNPPREEPSGAYRSRSFEPFPSPEEGLYGGREDVTFEEQQGNPRQRLAFLQEDDKSTHKLAQQHDLFLGEIEGVTSGSTPAAGDVPVVDAVSEPAAPPPDPEEADAEEADFGGLDEVPDVDEGAAARSAVEQLAAVRAEAEELQAAVLDHELGANAPTSMHGQPELAEMAPTRPIDVNLEGAEGFTPAPHDLTPPPQDIASHDVTPAPQELTLDDVEIEEDGRASSTSNRRIEPTYPEFNVIPDYDQPVDPGSGPSGPAPAQSGHTIVASFEELGLPAPDESVDAMEPSAPSDFAVLPSFGGAQIGGGFTMVASFDAEAEADVGASSTMIATAGDIEAWRSAGVASAEPPGTSAVIPPEFDEEQTGMFTPAPGTLAPLGLSSPSSDPMVGSPALHDEALTAMRVGRGGQPSGAGFELNPRGPAPELAPPSPAADANQSAPGPSSRRQTNLDSGGRPGPPPKPVVTAPTPDPAPSVVPPLRGSGPVDDVPVPAAVAPRRSLVEDALAELKRKTDSRRQKRDTLSPIEEKAKAIAEERKANKQERRRRRLGSAEMVDPAIADLYKAAMTDLTRTSE